MAESTRSFSNLSIRNWRQFREVNINFHPQLTIITGANGAGKSTLLQLLTRHFGYSRNLLATPQIRGGKSFFSFGIFYFAKSFGIFAEKNRVQQSVIGSIVYSDGTSSEITVPQNGGLQYQLQVSQQKEVFGVHIDSHRPPCVYRHVGQIDTSPTTKQYIFDALNGEFVNYFNSGNSSQGSLFHIKKALISMSIFGHGNSTMSPLPELIDLYNEFEEKLRTVLPKSLGFQKIIIRSPEVILVTESGNFVIDACSGGVTKIIEIVWQIYFFSKIKQNFVVTMDEPENHLHPAMQQSFLADLISAFPQAQFVVVTHSPFMISSIENSKIYVLRHEETDQIVEDADDTMREGFKGQRVVSYELDVINRAGTAADILRDVLGVPGTIPNWASSKIEKIINEYRHKKLDEESISEIYGRLEKEGLIGKYPEVLQNLVSGK